MTVFKTGDKVRVNEGLLEGETGVVTGTRENVTVVKLDSPSYFGGDLDFYTETLVSADEDTEALAALKLHPELVRKEYAWRLTTFVDGIMYISLPVPSDIIKNVLSKPPAGLYAVEYIEKGTANGIWKALWTE